MTIDRKRVEEQYLIFDLTIKTQALMVEHLPRFYDDRKKLIYNIALTDELFNNKSKHQTDQHKKDPLVFDNPEIICSRWRSMQLPLMFPPRNSNTVYLMREDIFQYDNEFGKKPNTIEWYLNFADSDLFVAYGGSLMAQDELQVAEHPSLASLREMLTDLSETDSKYAPCTRDEENRPTPFIIQNVERRISISIAPNAAEGRPAGLYGNNFATASKDAIENACTRIIPPTITNFIAMEAPAGSKGKYTSAQITDIFTTAYTAFTAAKHSSAMVNTSSPTVTIHTGNWGTGAYGGSKTIMALLQIAAARAAHIDRLVYHTFSNEYSTAYSEALALLTNKLISGDNRIAMPLFLKKIQELGFKWGVSDGN